MARLDTTNIDLDEIHVAGLGNASGTSVSLNDSDVRTFGNSFSDSSFSGGSVNTGNNTEIALGEFRNLLLPILFQTGTNGMVAKTGYGNASGYFNGFVQSGYDIVQIFNYVSGSTYNNDFAANATILGKTDNLRLGTLKNAAVFTNSGNTPTVGGVNLVMGGNYDSNVGALGTNFGVVPDLSTSSGQALYQTRIANAQTHFSNTGWTRLVLTPSGGSVKYLNRVDATFSSTVMTTPLAFFTVGSPIYAGVSYIWQNIAWADFFGNPYSGGSPTYPAQTYNWTVSLE